MIEFKRRLQQGDMPVTLEDDELFETLDNEYPKKLSHSSTVSLGVPPLSNRLQTPKRSMAAPSVKAIKEFTKSVIFDETKPIGKPPIGNFKLNNLKQF